MEPMTTMTTMEFSRVCWCPHDWNMERWPESRGKESDKTTLLLSKVMAEGLGWAACRHACHALFMAATDISCHCSRMLCRCPDAIWFGPSKACLFMLVGVWLEKVTTLNEITHHLWPCFHWAWTDRHRREYMVIVVVISLARPPLSHCCIEVDKMK